MPAWRAREWVEEADGDVHEALTSRVLTVLDKAFGHSYYHLVGRWYSYAMQLGCLIQGGHRFELADDGLPPLCTRCLLILDMDYSLMDEDQRDMLRLVRP